MAATPAQQHDTPQDSYTLDEQIGFLLRRANQRHLGIFNEMMVDGLTAQQFAVLVRVREYAPISQNELGRKAAMDQSTINGVVQRLKARNLVTRTRSEEDQRRLLLTLTPEGEALVNAALPVAQQITERTCAPLTEGEMKQLVRLLGKIT